MHFGRRLPFAATMSISSSWDLRGACLVEHELFAIFGIFVVLRSAAKPRKQGLTDALANVDVFELRDFPGCGLQTGHGAPYSSGWVFAPCFCACVFSVSLTCLFVCPVICLSVYLSVCLTYLSIWSLLCGPSNFAEDMVDAKLEKAKEIGALEQSNG